VSDTIRLHAPPPLDHPDAIRVTYRRATRLHVPPSERGLCEFHPHLGGDSSAFQAVPHPDRGLPRGELRFGSAWRRSKLVPWECGPFVVRIGGESVGLLIPPARGGSCWKYVDQRGTWELPVPLRRLWFGIVAERDGWSRWEAAAAWAYRRSGDFVVVPDQLEDRSRTMLSVLLAGYLSDRPT
jgi:hypothetical protein